MVCGAGCVAFRAQQRPPWRPAAGARAFLVYPRELFETLVAQQGARQLAAGAASRIQSLGNGVAGRCYHLAEIWHGGALSALRSLM